MRRGLVVIVFALVASPHSAATQTIAVSSDRVDAQLEEMKRKATNPCKFGRSHELERGPLAALTSVPEDTRIEMSGSGPTVSIDAKGNVVRGDAVTTVAVHKVLQLLQLAGAMGFSGVDKRALDATCLCHKNHAGWAEITIFARGGAHTVKNNHGCLDQTLRPALRTLEDSIDAVVRDSR